MTPQGRVSPVATQRDGVGEGCTLCIFAKSETSSVSRRKHSRALVTRQLPQEENSSSWAVGPLVFVSFQDCTLQPLVASVWSVALNHFFSRKLEEGFIAVSKPISCIACAKRLIAVSLRLLLRLSQNVTLSIAKYCAVEKTGANRTWETLFVQNLNNILCQNKCDNGLLFLAP